MTTKGKRQRTKAQHFVPQFYLRGFTNSSGKLFCYDKVQDRVYATCPADAAQESNFYEITPGTTKEPVPDNAVENQLARLEQAWAPMLTRLIKSADSDTITIDQLDFFSPFVALQWMRTKTYRETTHEVLQKFGQSYADDLIRLNFPGKEPKVKVTFPTAAMAAVQAEQMLNPDTILRMARDLDRHIWVIGLNETEHPFYTSDHPVVRRANCHNQDRPLVGVRDPGVEFVFPLDSRHILLILERGHFKEWRQHDQHAITLTAEQVKDYNGLQVRKSSQRVYCANDDFNLACAICTAEPTIRNPNRPRVRVETTPMVDEGDLKKNYTFVTALE